MVPKNTRHASIFNRRTDDEGDQWDRNFAPLHRLEDEKRRSENAREELAKVITETGGNPNYAIGGAPKFVSAQKQMMLDLVADKAELKETAEEMLRMLIRREKECEEETQEEKQQLDEIDKIATELWPDLRLMLHEQIMTMMKEVSRGNKDNKENLEKIRLLELEIKTKEKEFELSRATTPADSLLLSADLKLIHEELTFLKSKGTDDTSRSEQEMDDLREKLQSATLKYLRIDADLKATQSQLTMAQTATRELQNQSRADARVKSDLENYKRLYEDARASTVSLEQRVATANEELHRLMVKNTYLESANTKQVAEVAVKDQKISDLERVEKRLTLASEKQKRLADDRLTELTNEKNQVSQAKTDAQNLQSRLNLKDETIVDLKAKNANLAEDLDTKKSESIEQQAELARIQEELQESNRQKAQLIQETEQREQTTARVTNPNAIRDHRNHFLDKTELDTLRKERQIWNTDKETWSRDKRILITDNAKLSGELKDFEEKLAKATSDVSDLSSSLDELRVSYSQQENALGNMETKYTEEKRLKDILVSEKSKLENEHQQKVTSLREEANTNLSNFTVLKKEYDAYRESAQGKQRLDNDDILHKNRLLASQQTRIDDLAQRAQKAEKDLVSRTTESNKFKEQADQRKINLLARTTECANLQAVVKDKNTEILGLTRGKQDLLEQLSNHQNRADSLDAQLISMKSLKDGLEKSLQETAASSKSWQDYARELESGQETEVDWRRTAMEYQTAIQEVTLKHTTLLKNHSILKVQDSENQKDNKYYREAYEKEKRERMSYQQDVREKLEEMRTLRNADYEAKRLLLDNERLVDIIKRTEKLAEIRLHNWNAAEESHTRLMESKDLNSERDRERIKKLLAERKGWWDKIDDNRKEILELNKRLIKENDDYARAQVSIREEHRVQMAAALDNTGQLEKENSSLKQQIRELRKNAGPIGETNSMCESAHPYHVRDVAMMPIDNIYERTGLYDESDDGVQPKPAKSKSGNRDDIISQPGDAMNIDSITFTPRKLRTQQTRTASRISMASVDEADGGAQLIGDGDYEMIDYDMEQETHDQRMPGTPREMYSQVVMKSIETPEQFNRGYTPIETPNRSLGLTVPRHRASQRDTSTESPLEFDTTTETPCRKGKSNRESNRPGVSTSTETPSRRGSTIETPLSRAQSQSATRESASPGLMDHVIKTRVKFLISGKPSDGPSLTYPEVGDELRSKLDADIDFWNKIAKKPGNWAKRSELIRCVHTRLSGMKKKQNVHPDPDHKTACSRCITNRKLCILVPWHNPTPVVLPLPKDQRQKVGSSRDIGYYVKALPIDKE